MQSDNAYIDEQEVRQLVKRALPENEIREIVDAVKGYKIVAFTGDDRLVLFGTGDKGLMLFRLTETTIDQAVADYQAGKRL